jgi:circadian clock protein KaiA
LFLDSVALAQALQEHLARDRYAIQIPDTEADFFELVQQQKQQLDCLVLQAGEQLEHVVRWLHLQSTLLPVVIVWDEAQNMEDSSLGFMYHLAEMPMAIADGERLAEYIDRAIASFLNLSPSEQLPQSDSPDLTWDLTTQNFLMRQQRRLSDKLKERLGYLGVYYKRNPKNFLRHLRPGDRQKLLKQLKNEYREIILEYFQDSPTLNQKIDNFVNTAFFADLSVAHLVETHMDLMDEFSKQLKLEGRSEEVLLDYRLTLIDTIAHLCEMYRRSIPRES